MKTKTKKTRSRFVYVPYRGVIAAGQLHEAIGDTGSVKVQQARLPFTKGAKYFALGVRGDSMIGRGINDGDVVIIREQNTARNGDVVVALVDNDEATLKTFYKEKGHIRLQPENPSYKPIIVSTTTPIQIQGVNVTTIKKKDTASVFVVPTPQEDYKVLPVNKIICGDVLDVLKKLPTGSIDLIVTSPPYNLKNSTGNGMKDGRGGKWANAALQKGYTHHNDNMPHEDYVKWQRACLEEMLRLLPDHGAIFYNHKWRVQGGVLQDRQDIVSELPVRQIIIWQRKGGFNFNPGYFLPTYEVIYLIAKPKFRLLPKANAHGDVWTFTQEMKNEHPAAFPVKLIDRIISSTDANVILDPFMGSGTTAISALNFGRKFIGIDISPEYCRMAEERLRYNFPNESL